MVMKEEDVRRCEIQAWYPAFRRHSLRTLILPLPEEFISFLMRDDGLYLPKDSLAIPTRTQVQNPQLQAEDYVHWDEEDDEGDEPEVPSFPDLAKQVQTMIQSLGGAVFPKLNWSAPKDTAWISSSGSLKCQNFEEISLLLKASDNLIHDLCHAFDSCNDKSRERPAQFVLALRKWYDLRPEMEFRGFVRGKLLVGICQREVTGFYATLVGREDELEDMISSFFDVNVREVFGGEDYTFDVYLTKDLRVKLLDFNPWGGSTLPLLFSWDELEQNYAKVLGRLNGDGLSDDDLCLEVGRRMNLLESGKEEQTVVEETVVESTDLDPVHGSNGMTINAQRREVSRRVEFRVVKSEGLVQPGLRVGTGVPIDFVNQGAWEDIIKREAEKEAREQEKERAAGGG
jgi:hypothetical protein